MLGSLQVVETAPTTLVLSIDCSTKYTSCLHFSLKYISVCANVLPSLHIWTSSSYPCVRNCVWYMYINCSNKYPIFHYDNTQIYMSIHITMLWTRIGCPCTLGQINATQVCHSILLHLKRGVFIYSLLYMYVLSMSRGGLLRQYGILIGGNYGGHITRKQRRKKKYNK